MVELSIITQRKRESRNGLRLSGCSGTSVAEGVQVIGGRGNLRRKV